MNVSPLYPWQSAVTAVAPNVIGIGNILLETLCPHGAIAVRVRETAVGIAEDVPRISHEHVATFPFSTIEVCIKSVNEVTVVYPYMGGTIVGDEVSPSHINASRPHERQISDDNIFV